MILLIIIIFILCFWLFISGLNGIAKDLDRRFPRKK
jgi:hypothetical protein